MRKKMQLIEYENAATISTTFPRAIKQDEGYEIALKSIAHAPVKNLIHSNITLTKYNQTNNPIQSHELMLTSRFYESQADILMEIHRVIDTLSSIDDPPDLVLYEKNNETTMKFLNEMGDYYYVLKIKEDMFLNRPFKFKGIDRSQQRLKRSTDQIDIPSRTPLNKLEKSVSDMKSKHKKKFKAIEEQMTILREEYRILNYKLDKDPHYYTDRYERHKTIKRFEEIDKKQKEMGDDIELQKEYLKSIERTMPVISDRLDEVAQLNANVKNNRLVIEQTTQRLQDQVELINTLLSKVDDLQNQLDLEKDKLRMHITNMDKKNDGMEQEVIRLRRHIDEKHKEVVTYMKKLTDQLGIDEDQSIAIDTSNYVSSKSKKEIHVTEIRVSSTPIVTTRLGMIYCDIVENSLINNKQTRLLTAVPIISKRGYNYYEFKTPIYKVISVLQFSTISFTIADTEGFLMDFSLEGDELSNYQSDAKRKYPSMLNLHIRRRL